jgi:soluble lytic murein transglycosylase-like protein
MPARALAALTMSLALIVLAGCGEEEAPELGLTDAPKGEQAKPPRPDEGIPHGAGALAGRLRKTRDDLGAALDRWRADGSLREPAPRDVVLYALYEQRIYILLSSRDRLARAVLERLNGAVADEARDILAARRELSALAGPPQPRRHFETGKSLPAGKLRRLYRKAERRFDVSWKLLAAVNFVETAFNKLRNNSTSGAQGPMQFIPSTWRAYGMGGDIHDPHDAIMGAANYLHASGAPGDNREALYHYNPSDHYVDAVLRYTRAIRHDPDAYLAFHSWQVFVNTKEDGIVRITGPGVR